MKVKYVGEEREAKLYVAENVYIGDFTAFEVYEVPEVLGQFLIVEFPYLFEKVEEVDEGEI